MNLDYTGELVPKFLALEKNSSLSAPRLVPMSHLNSRNMEITSRANRMDNKLEQESANAFNEVRNIGEGEVTYSLRDFLYRSNLMFLHDKPLRLVFAYLTVLSENKYMYRCAIQEMKDAWLSFVDLFVQNDNFGLEKNLYDISLKEWETEVYPLFRPKRGGEPRVMDLLLDQAKDLLFIKVHIPPNNLTSQYDNEWLHTEKSVLEWTKIFSISEYAKETGFTYLSPELLDYRGMSAEDRSSALKILNSKMSMQKFCIAYNDWCLTYLSGDSAIGMVAERNWGRLKDKFGSGVTKETVAQAADEMLVPMPSPRNPGPTFQELLTLEKEKVMPAKDYIVDAAPSMLMMWEGVMSLDMPAPPVSNTKMENIKTFLLDIEKFASLHQFQVESGGIERKRSFMASIQKQSVDGLNIYFKYLVGAVTLENLEKDLEHQTRKRIRLSKLDHSLETELLDENVKNISGGILGFIRFLSAKTPDGWVRNFEEMLDAAKTFEEGEAESEYTALRLEPGLSRDFSIREVVRKSGVVRAELTAAKTSLEKLDNEEGTKTSLQTQIINKRNFVDSGINMRDTYENSLKTQQTQLEVLLGVAQEDRDDDAIDAQETLIQETEQNIRALNDEIQPVEEEIIELSNEIQNFDSRYHVEEMAYIEDLETDLEKLDMELDHILTTMKRNRKSQIQNNYREKKNELNDLSKKFQTFLSRGVTKEWLRLRRQLSAEYKAQLQFDYGERKRVELLIRLQALREEEFARVHNKFLLDMKNHFYRNKGLWMHSFNSMMYNLHSPRDCEEALLRYLKPTRDIVSIGAMVEAIKQEPLVVEALKNKSIPRELRDVKSLNRDDVPVYLDLTTGEVQTNNVLFRNFSAMVGLFALPALDRVKRREILKALQRVSIRLKLHKVHTRRSPLPILGPMHRFARALQALEKELSQTDYMYDNVRHEGYEKIGAENRAKLLQLVKPTSLMEEEEKEEESMLIVEEDSDDEDEETPEEKSQDTEELLDDALREIQWNSDMLDILNTSTFETEQDLYYLLIQFSGQNYRVSIGLDQQPLTMDLDTGELSIVEPADSVYDATEEKFVHDPESERYRVALYSPVSAREARVVLQLANNLMSDAEFPTPASRIAGNNPREDPSQVARFKTSSRLAYYILDGIQRSLFNAQRAVAVSNSEQASQGDESQDSFEEVLLASEQEESDDDNDNNNNNNDDDDGVVSANAKVTGGDGASSTGVNPVSLHHFVVMNKARQNFEVVPIRESDPPIKKKMYSVYFVSPNKGHATTALGHLKTMADSEPFKSTLQTSQGRNSLRREIQRTMLKVMFDGVVDKAGPLPQWTQNTRSALVVLESGSLFVGTADEFADVSGTNSVMLASDESFTDRDYKSEKAHLKKVIRAISGSNTVKIRKKLLKEHPEVFAYLAHDLQQTPTKADTERIQGETEEERIHSYGGLVWNILQSG
ncbi:MAG: hypothetical protein ACTSUE_09050 [Promethearchaeota archaeon]